MSLTQCRNLINICWMNEWLEEWCEHISHNLISLWDANAIVILTMFTKWMDHEYCCHMVALFSKCQPPHHGVTWLLFHLTLLCHFPPAMCPPSQFPHDGVDKSGSNMQTQTSSIHKEESERLWIGLRCQFRSPLYLDQRAMHFEK